MFDWGRLLTRLVILLLLFLAALLARDPLVRVALIRAAEDKIGAKVEIGKVRTSFRDRKAYLTDVRIADPRDPMKNMIQAESMTLKLDFDSLIHRRFEILEGSTTELVFNAPRSTSGEISNEANQFGSNQHGSNQQLADIGTIESSRVRLAEPFSTQDFLDQLRLASQTPDISKLDLTSAANRIFESLDRQLNSQVVEITNLKATVREMHDVVNFDGNVLRNQDRWDSAQRRLSTLHSNIESISRKLTTLDQQLTRDRNSLVVAREKDEQAFTRRGAIKGDSLTQLLLNDSQLDLARSIVDWYLDFRKVFPDPMKDFHQQATDGSNFTVTGISNVPSFLVRSMQLDGSGRFAGNKFNFTGQVENFSTEPQKVDGPITFMMRAQGDTHFIVNGTLNRKNQFPADSVTIRCPGLPLQKQMLGAPGSMQVSVSPCRNQLEIMLDSIGDQIDGKLNFTYDNLVMQIEELAEIAGGREAAEQINLELANISHYNVAAVISGPVSAPEIRFQSDLGQRFAEKLNALFDDRIQMAKSTLDHQLKLQLNRLDQTIGEGIRLAAQKLENEIVSQEKQIIADFRNRSTEDPLSRTLRR